MLSFFLIVFLVISQELYVNVMFKPKIQVKPHTCMCVDISNIANQNPLQCNNRSDSTSFYELFLNEMVNNMNHYVIVQL